MASVLICSNPSHGHVGPLLAIAAELIRRGDSVRFLTGQRFRAAVESVGASFRPLPADCDFDDRDLDSVFPERVGLTGLAAMKLDLRNVFLRPVPSQYRAIQELLAAEPTDAVVAEPLFLGAVPLVIDELTQSEVDRVR